MSLLSIKPIFRFEEVVGIVISIRFLDGKRRIMTIWCEGFFTIFNLRSSGIEGRLNAAQLSQVLSLIHKEAHPNRSWEGGQVK